MTFKRFVKRNEQHKQTVGIHLPTTPYYYITVVGPVKCDAVNTYVNVHDVQYFPRKMFNFLVLDFSFFFFFFIHLMQ